MRRATPQPARRRPAGATFERFARQVYAWVRRIPRGRVATYGDIGAAIPAPPGILTSSYRRVRARWVGYALARCPDSLPWQRVINARGQISPRLGHGPHLQQRLLRREGVRFGPGNRISLERYAWTPRPRAGGS